MLTMRTFIIALFLLSNSPRLAAVAERDMPIIAYFGVPDWQTTEGNFRVFSECGFTVSLYPFYPNLDQLQKACRYAEKHGVQVLAKCPEMVTAPAHTANVLKKEKGFFGYFIKDEPSAPEIHIKEKEIVAIRRYDNEHPCYINLHPYYHEDWVEPTLKVKRYSDYLKIASASSCQQISFDFYPVTTAGIRPTWYQNLEMIRKESSSSGKPFWGFVLSIPHDVPYTQTLITQHPLWHLFVCKYIQILHTEHRQYNISLTGLQVTKKDSTFMMPQ